MAIMKEKKIMTHRQCRLMLNYLKRHYKKESFYYWVGEKHELDGDFTSTVHYWYYPDELFRSISVHYHIYDYHRTVEMSYSVTVTTLRELKQAVNLRPRIERFFSTQLRFLLRAGCRDRNPFNFPGPTEYE